MSMINRERGPPPVAPRSQTRPKMTRPVSEDVGQGMPLFLSVCLFICLLSVSRFDILCSLLTP